MLERSAEVVIYLAWCVNRNCVTSDFNLDIQPSILGKLLISGK